ncbi:SIR2 family protein [Paenibacillus humicus]|uniref:SIR2 family protein n=1 Tax=Paenibacillus humicus TaxID=412861 RepID=UPI0013E2A6D8|nr:SIR2 family protein [Paenibacillus humicus]
MNYLNFNEELFRMTQLAAEGKLIPLIGSGFTRGLKSKRGIVPDGNEANEIMKKIIIASCPEISEDSIHDYELDNTSSVFFSREVPKDKQRDFLTNYFTKVVIDKSDARHSFVNLDWPYIYTLNIDDAIEKNTNFEKIVPYKKISSSIFKHKKPVFKLHGDANYEVEYEDAENLIFSPSQYERSLASEENKTMRDYIRADFGTKNIIFVGCSLLKEFDIGYILKLIPENDLQYNKRILVRTSKPDKAQEIALSNKGITDILLVESYDIFYSEFSKKLQEIQGKDRFGKYKYKNPSFERVETSNYKRQLDLLYGEKMFEINANVFSKAEFYIQRTLASKIVRELSDKVIVCIKGRRFSGKSYLLANITEMLPDRSIYYFPSNITVDDILIQSLVNEQDCIFLFDSNSIIYSASRLLLDLQSRLIENRIKIIIATNSSDGIWSRFDNKDEYYVRNYFSIDELKAFNQSASKLGWIDRISTQTNIDYIFYLNSVQKVGDSKKFQATGTLSEKELAAIIIVASRDKAYYGELLSIGFDTNQIEQLTRKMSLLIETEETTREEQEYHSGRKLVHNSKGALINYLSSGIGNQKIINAISLVVKKLAGNPRYNETSKTIMLYDTLNQLFSSKEVSGVSSLILNLYSELDVILSSDMHYWLQRAKAHYNIRGKDKEALSRAFTFGIKSYDMAKENEDHKLKCALTISLICGRLWSLESILEEKIKMMDKAIEWYFKAFCSGKEYDKYINKNIENASKWPTENDFAKLLRYSMLQKDKLNHIRIKELEKLVNISNRALI